LLAANGDRILEMFAGSAFNLMLTGNPACPVGGSRASWAHRDKRELNRLQAMLSPVLLAVLRRQCCAQNHRHGDRTYRLVSEADGDKLTQNRSIRQRVQRLMQDSKLITVDAR
jgi:hypothetical protein